MTIESGVLALGRRSAEARMTATGRASRPGGQVWNPDTQQYDETTVVSYEGPCRVRATANLDHGLSVADQAFIESQYVISLPVGTSGGIAKGDDFEIITNPDDPDLNGRKYTVVFVPAGSQTTARRIPVRETQ